MIENSCDKKNIIDQCTIAEKIVYMDFDQIVRAAYEGWISGYRTGVCLIDLRNGELVSKSISPDEIDECADENRVALYKIDADDNVQDLNRLLPIDVMYRWQAISDEEYKIAKESIKPEEYINYLQQRHLKRVNLTAKELAIKTLAEWDELEWLHIYDQLDQRYK